MCKSCWIWICPIAPSFRQSASMPEKGGLVPPPTTARYFRQAMIPFAATEAATDACEVLLIYFLREPHRMTLNRDVGGSMMGVNQSDFPGLDGCLAHLSVDSVLGALQKVVRSQMNPPNHIAKQSGEPSLIPIFRRHLTTASDPVERERLAKQTRPYRTYASVLQALAPATAALKRSDGVDELLKGRWTPAPSYFQSRHRDGLHSASS
jgi:hypothetical protein